MSDLTSDELSRKLPTVVVSMAAIFGSVSLCGDKSIAEEVMDLVAFFKEKGYYILVDCEVPLSQAYDYLVAQNIPFGGLTYGDDMSFADRVDSHIGWGNVAAVIDEDMMRLSEAKGKGVSCIQIMQGCVISQVSFGKLKTFVPEYKASYSASMREGSNV